MHGLVNRALECFVRDTYGTLAWADVAAMADLDDDTFEAMLSYDDRTTDAVIVAAERKLGKRREDLLEDLGTFLVSHRNYEVLRRLLRFGGESFIDFLISLEELPDRARLAVHDLELAGISVWQDGPKSFVVACSPGWSGFGYILVGAIRAMADDYGSLVLIDIKGVEANGSAQIAVTVHDTRFTSGRTFDLTAPVG